MYRRALYNRRRSRYCACTVEVIQCGRVRCSFLFSSRMGCFLCFLSLGFIFFRVCSRRITGLGRILGRDRKVIRGTVGFSSLRRVGRPRYSRPSIRTLYNSEEISQPHFSNNFSS